jgi:multiple sugar transport system permease protein
LLADRLCAGPHAVSRASSLLRVSDRYDFVQPLIYLKDTKLLTLNVGLNMFKDAYAQEFSQMPNMHWFMAIATLIVLAELVIFVFLQQYFIEGVQLTGLKG